MHGVGQVSLLRSSVLNCTSIVLSTNTDDQSIVVGQFNFGSPEAGPGTYNNYIATELAVTERRIYTKFKVH
jgi:hypothetical protein